MFSGDAPRCTATMSVIRDRSAPRPRICSPTSPTPTGSCARSCCRSRTSPRERRAARRQRRSGAAHVDRGGLYPLIRAAIAVVMRDLNVALLMADIVEGVPVSYATFVGYDEVAHHSGIREPDAFAVLSATIASSRGWSARSRRRRARITWWCSPTTVRPRARPSASATARRSRTSCAAALAHGRGARARPRSTRLGATSARCSPTRARIPGVGGRIARARHAQPDRSRARSRSGPTARRWPSASAARTRAERGRGDRARLGRPRPRLPAAQPRASHARADRRGPPAAAGDARRPSRDRVRDGALARARRARDRRARAAGAWPTTRSRARTRSRRSTTRRPSICAATIAFPHCPDILVNGMYDPRSRRGRAVRGVHGLPRRPRRAADPAVRRRFPRSGAIRRRRSWASRRCTHS